MAKGTLVRIAPDGEITEHRCEKSTGFEYPMMRDLVGGYIERVKVRYNGVLRDCYVDEEGLIKRLEYNPAITGMLDGAFKNYTGTIHGPGVIWVPDKKVK